MRGLAFHCHERLINTKMDKESGGKWRKMEKNGDEMLQMNGFLSIGRALAPYNSIK